MRLHLINEDRNSIKGLISDLESYSGGSALREIWRIDDRTIHFTGNGYLMVRIE